MSAGSSSSFLRVIQLAAGDTALAGLSDQELLQRYLTQRDVEAFHVLLARHGPMVLDVCRAVVPNQTDAEDAFQATFLVFVRSARTIQKVAALGSWLHGVAYRTALKAKAKFAARQKHETRIPVPPTSVPDDLTWREVRQILHEELDRLPERSRHVLLLCYLQGKTQDEAAALLGLPKGTLKGRLERARELLRGRLVRRGLGPAAVLIAATSSGAEIPCVPLALVDVTTRVVCECVTGSIVTSSASVSILARGVLNAMFVSKLKISAVMLLLVVGTMVTAAWFMHLTVQAGALDGNDPALPATASGKSDPSVVEPIGGEPPNPSTRRVFRFPTNIRVNTIACSPDGKLIAVGNEGPMLYKMTNGRSVVINGWQPTVEVLDTKSGKTIATLKLINKEEETVLPKTNRDYFEVNSLAFSPDSSVVAVGTSIGQVKLFDARIGNLVQSLDDVQGKKEKDQTADKFAGFTRAIGSADSLAFSPDGSLLAVCGGSFADIPLFLDNIERLGRTVTGPGRLKLWDVKSGALKRDLVGHAHVSTVVFSPDGKMLASAGSWLDDRKGGTGVIIWNSQTGTKIRIFLTDANGGTHAVAFSPNSKLVAIGARIFDKDNNTSTSAISLTHVSSGIMEWKQTVPGWAKPVYFSPDGKGVVVLSSGPAVKLLDAETGNLKNELQSKGSPARERWNDLSISPRANVLVIGGVDAEKPFVEVRDFGDVSAWVDPHSAKVGDLQKERLGILRERAAVTEKAFRGGNVSATQFLQAKLAALNAELELCDTDKDRLSVLEKIVAQTKDMENLVLELVRSGNAPASSALNAKLARVEAELALERAKSKPTDSSKGVGGK